MVSFDALQKGWKKLEDLYESVSDNPVGNVINTIYNPAQTVNNLRTVWNDATSSSSYSDYVRRANGRTNGWYGTIAGALPIAGGIHNAILNRDRTNDILNNTGRSWWDVLGYNSSALTGGSSAGLRDAVGTGIKMARGTHSLYEFYAGEPDKMENTGAPMFY